MPSGTTPSPPPSPPPIPLPPWGWHRTSRGSKDDLGMYFDPSRAPEYHENRASYDTRPQPSTRRSDSYGYAVDDRREPDMSWFDDKHRSPPSPSRHRNYNPPDYASSHDRYHEDYRRDSPPMPSPPRPKPSNRDPRDESLFDRFFGSAPAGTIEELHRHRNRAATPPPRANKTEEQKTVRSQTPEMDLYGFLPGEKYYRPWLRVGPRARRGEQADAHTEAVEFRAPRGHDRSEPSGRPPARPRSDIPYGPQSSDPRSPRSDDRFDSKRSGPAPPPPRDAPASSKPTHSRPPGREAGGDGYETREDPWEYVFGTKGYVTRGPEDEKPWWWEQQKR